MTNIALLISRCFARKSDHMNRFKRPFALLAALSVGLAVSSCSSLFNSLSSTFHALDEKLSEGVRIFPPRAETRVEPVAESAAPAVPAPAKVAPVAPNNATVLEFAGTPYTVLSAGTDGSVGPTGTYVLFGDWPQSIMAEGVTVDETRVAVVGAHIYYKGSDGAWYIRIMENAAGGYEGPGGFCYSDGTRVQNKHRKSCRYFKVEPIKWRVLTDNYNGSGKKLLLAEAALTNEQFCDTWGDSASFRDVDGSQASFCLDVTLRRLENGGYIHHNNYEHSRLRAFLNGIAYIQGDENIYVKGLAPYTRINEEFVDRGFLQTAFSPEIRDMIAVTNVENSNRQNSGLDLVQELTSRDRSLYDGTTKYPKFTCNNTKDKVFILNLKEVSRSDYGFVRILDGASPETTYRGLAHPMTDFARGHGVAHFSDDVVTTWWLRTPVLPIYFHRVIEEREDQEVGAVTSHSSLGLGMVGDPSVGVVPAICVN